MTNALNGWRADGVVLGAAALAIALYVGAVRARGRAWPARRSLAFGAAIATALLAFESPLDAAADRSFAPHMLQHLILTDLVAPLALLAAPLPLLLGALPVGPARRVVRALHHPVVRFAAFPAVTWLFFVASLYALHVGPLFERTLEDPGLHAAAHGIFLVTSLLFWLPVVATPPTPWTDGPLAYPVRMLYVLIAMPAEAFLGFAIYGAPRVLYAHYASAGLGDQRAAGEMMWIGSGLAMFAAFMLVGVEWGAAERRLGESENRRSDRAAALPP